ncbi:hypothetical protein OS493_039953, partial [Desmophyllum pertusum]
VVTVNLNATEEADDEQTIDVEEEQDEVFFQRKRKLEMLRQEGAIPLEKTFGGLATSRCWRRAVMKVVLKKVERYSSAGDESDASRYMKFQSDDTTF